MSKLSLAEVKSAAATYVALNKLAVQDFNATKNNIVGALDKIGKMVTLDSNFYDKLPELDGDDLPLGKTVEEFFQDLILPIDWNQDTDGSRVMKFYSPTYRPVAYSHSFGRKVLPESIPNNNIERAVNNEAQFTEIVTLMTKRLSDSRDAWKYQCKRELLGKLIDMVSTAISGATAYVDATTNIVEGTYYKQGTPAEYCVCVVARTHTVGDTWASLQEAGFLIPLKMVREVAVPVDEATGEAFIKAVKETAEIASDISEGYSLNGNTIGAELGLKLYVKQGIMPSIEVDTLAGAFQVEKLALPIEVKVIKDFGATTSNAFGLIIDQRGVKIHKDYEAVRENMNGFGDFLSLFHHLEYTGFISRNTFITVLVPAEE